MRTQSRAWARRRSANTPEARISAQKRSISAPLSVDAGPAQRRADGDTGALAGRGR
ncbi:MAG: hypothetical protein HGA65_04515 [Oscillochloris sp.]|nr:hypothetical protein [Oscillochloris sp.]